MKFEKILIISFFFLLFGCEQYSTNNNKKINISFEKKYRNTGFTLVYNDGLNIKELDSRSLQIFHSNLKKKSFVKITNPLNNKSLIAEVRSNKVEFSKFYNSVISKRIAESLELDLKEPFVEIILISKDSTFVAKKSQTFEEEKKVAEKAPIDGIKISNLNNDPKENLGKNIKKRFSYSIKVADFYYKKTAKLMTDRIKSETFLKNIQIIELSKTNYRVLIGPFNDINSLKESFEKMNSLYFENLEIIKDV